ncbi:MAG: iron-sulfur cluster assembly scaffold protein [Pontixanthobacter sp.]
MTAADTSRLYTSDILGLALTLAQYPMAGRWSRTGQARSRSCGSIVEAGFDVGSHDVVQRVGIGATACAIGQAAAAIFATHAAGRTSGNIAMFHRDIDAWLRNDGPMPQWPDIAMLAPARAYAARHDAILLPWRAADAALSKIDVPR